jgi:hypothetical protein
MSKYDHAFDEVFRSTEKSIHDHSLLLPASVLLFAAICDSSCSFPPEPAPLSNPVSLVSAFKLTGSPNMLLLTVGPDALARVPLTDFECGSSDLFWLDEVSGKELLELAGAESSFSRSTDIGSPTWGGFEVVSNFGWDKVPRTVLECGGMVSGRRVCAL